MTSYNLVNGYWTASNYDLTTTILREEWGFDGIVITDWWAHMNDVVEDEEGSRQRTADMVRAQRDDGCCRRSCACSLRRAVTI